MECEVFSLEDDDYESMFITQEVSNSQNLVGELDKSEEGDGLFLGLSKTDFVSPCVSQVKPLHDPMYSDISDDEVFECSQKSVAQKR